MFRRVDIVVYDACVLYSAPLRDLLMRIAVADLCRAVWTDAIHEEWIRSLLASRSDLSRDNLERTRDLMNAHVRDALICGYEPLIPTLSLPDENDRHVLAAAIHAGADAIVTFNIKDFPPEALGRFGIVAQRPDEFIEELIGRSPGDVCSAVRKQRQALKNPPRTANELLETLAEAGIPRSATILRQWIGQI